MILKREKRRVRDTIDEERRLSAAIIGDDMLEDRTAAGGFTPDCDASWIAIEEMDVVLNPFESKLLVEKA